ncbi:MAG: hypothetical protein FJ011_20015 [Chloroflexi bacterium]|nr:hypothetical protein [Chloroflexota bacterium]
MQDYCPLDLSPYCNVGVQFAEAKDPLPIGRQSFHGLLFQIGTQENLNAACLLGFGGETGTRDAITIPLGVAPRHIIFAHALLESRLPEGEPPGHLIATYTFRYADGREVSAPIRERFEITRVPAGFGEHMFLATSDQKPGLLSEVQGGWGAATRYEGRWEWAGLRQMEATRSLPRAYCLWAWPNPHPERVIEAVTILPGDRKFLVAAITLGYVDEWPFCRTPKRTAVITLTRPEDADKPFKLEVEVDRGAATYPYPLPSDSPDKFLADDLAGWGQAQNEKASPAYAEIAAIPSATITVKSDGEELGKANWGELQAKGQVETERLRLEVVDRGVNWVHVTVLDDETGKPVPCRVHFRSPKGVPYQPHGHHNHVNSNMGTFFGDVGGDLRLGQITYAYIDGRCQGWLPRGDVLADVARGFEYEPLRTKVEIAPGQQALTLRLKRMSDMAGRRWFNGDSHVHAVSTQGAHCEAQGEGVQVVNLLATQLGHLFTNAEDFTGRPSVSQERGTIVFCSQENREHLFGHLTLWGLKEPVMPWCSDGPTEAELGGHLETLLSHWADACHAQGGTVIIPHFPNPNGEPAVLVATGRADAVEFAWHHPFFHLEYYRYLNCGYRLPLVGGTDKMTSDVPVGLCRTYANIPDDQEFNYENWCAAVRAGRTFMTSGPMIELTVDGTRIGDTVRLPGPGTVEVEARAHSIFPIHTLQIVQGGQVVAATEEAQGARALHLKADVRVSGHTWIAGRCGGPNYTALPHHDGWHRGIFAHTSPIYVAVGGEWWLFDRDAAQYMLTLIEGGLAYVRQGATLPRPGSVTHHHADADHLAFLERPFHEAREALRRRMHHPKSSRAR